MRFRFRVADPGVIRWKDPIPGRIHDFLTHLTGLLYRFYKTDPFYMYIYIYMDIDMSLGPGIAGCPTEDEGRRFQSYLFKDTKWKTRKRSPKKERL